MSDSGKKLKEEQDRSTTRPDTIYTYRFRDPRDKGTRKPPPVDKFGTAGKIGNRPSAVQSLLEEIKKGTDESKFGVKQLEQIKGIMGKAPASRLSSIVKGTTNLLKKKSKARGGMNEDGVVDLTTEMVIDE